MTDKKNSAAFFDFDLTITNYDSFNSFLSYYYLKQQKNYIYLPYLAAVFVLKKIGLINLYKTKRLVLSGLKNCTEKEIMELGKKYLFGYKDNLFCQKAVKQINKHIAATEHVFIVSSSPNIFFDKIKDILGVTNYFANNLEYINGRFTGNLAGIDCYGENKVQLIEEAARKYNIDLEDSYSYSDSHTDIPMLSAVGNPIAVNPNPILRDYALKMNWKIEDWH